MNALAHPTEPSGEAVQRAAVGGAVATSDWYERRHELESGMVFRCCFGGIVKLDRGVPGDGTRWVVLDWHDGWIADGNEIEPGDLEGEPIADDRVAIAKAKGGAQ